MGRELPRTLATLSPDYQRDAPDYEVIVVDNGSPTPVPNYLLDPLPNAKLIRLDPAPGSPARACNVGIEAASADTVGVFIDGARMASPGVVANAHAAMRTERTIVSTLAFHLGSEPQMQSAKRGYDQQVEDRLLASIDWHRDGYELFTVSVFAGSSHRGWFGPMGESNGLFLSAALWQEVGGFDESFDRPGGGLVNHDLYRRTCELPYTDLTVLLGEGTFHQYHGGASTSGRDLHDELWAEYESIRGRPFVPPTKAASYYGSVAPQSLPHLLRSAELAQPRDLPPLVLDTRSAPLFS